MARTSTPRAQLDSPVKNRLVGALLTGKKVSEVSKQFHVPWSTTKDIFTRYVQTGTTKNAPRSGRPRILKPIDRRHLRRAAKKNRFWSHQRLAMEMPRKVSARTVKRELDSQNLKRRLARHAPYVTKKQRLLRVSRAQEILQLPMENIKQWIFSDECYVYMGSRPGSIYCTRSPDEEYHEDCVIPTFTKSSVRVMVWGCITYGKKGPLIVLEYPGGKGGGMTSERYVEQVLDGVLLPFYKALSRRRPNVQFLQDNARCHTAKNTINWFTRNHIPLVPHPASSPDINAVEPCWQDLKRSIWDRPHPPTSHWELRKAIIEAWDSLPLSKVNNYILSMHRRAQAVIDAKGGPTRY